MDSFMNSFWTQDFKFALVRDSLHYPKFTPEISQGSKNTLDRMVVLRITNSHLANRIKMPVQSVEPSFAFLLQWSALSATDFVEFKVMLRPESIGWTVKHKMEYSARIAINISLSTIEWESYCWSFGSDFLQQFIEYETVEGSRVKLKPNKFLRQFYENNPDIFDAIDNQSIEDRVVFDPDKRLPSGRFYSQGLSWWWYTDDKKVKDEQEKILEEAMKNSRWI